MSKKENSYKLNKQQLEKEQREDWEFLKERLGIEEPAEPIKLPKKRFSFWIKKLSPALAAIFVFGGIGTNIYFETFHQAETPAPPQEPQDQTRYCAQSEYTKNEVSMTLKEYSLQNGDNILYFDDYDVAEDLFDYSYTLNDTGEIIAFKEEYCNIDNGYLIFLSVTDNLTEMDEFIVYKNQCADKIILNSITINYHFYDIGYTTWEYNGYRYYLETIGPATLEETLDLVEELLQK